MRKISNYSGWINEVCLLIKNIFLTFDEKTITRELKIKEDNLRLFSKKEKAHKRYIYTLLNIGNEHIASGSDYFIYIYI